MRPPSRGPDAGQRLVSVSYTALTFTNPFTSCMKQALGEVSPRACTDSRRRAYGQKVTNPSGPVTHGFHSGPGPQYPRLPQYPPLPQLPPSPPWPQWPSRSCCQAIPETTDAGGSAFAMPAPSPSAVMPSAPAIPAPATILFRFIMKLPSPTQSVTTGTSLNSFPRLAIWCNPPQANG